MRLTEAFHFYNDPVKRSSDWIEAHYSHFRPTAEDFVLKRQHRRTKAQNNQVSEPEQPKEVIMATKELVDIFEDS